MKNDILLIYRGLFTPLSHRMTSNDKLIIRTRKNGEEWHERKLEDVMNGVEFDCDYEFTKADNASLDDEAIELLLRKDPTLKRIVVKLVEDKDKFEKLHKGG